LTDNTYTTYGYDDDAQLTSSLGYTSGGSPVASEQLGFGYDFGWNMTNRSVNGSPAAYVVNDLNEVTNAATVPCTYDQNGNRITYGQGSGTTQYTYDDENRLIRWTYVIYRTDFTYDGLGRLRARTEYTSGNPTSTTRYIYDGKRVIQERDGSNNPLVGYTRGKDLSGSLEGAGGIGGLLARSHGYSGGSWSAHNFYHADALGNVTYMINSSQAMVASYRYDPYGRTISSSGTLAAANLYRFSSKELHVNSGLYYYLYRFYDPNTQRWMNRDPIEDDAFLAMYVITESFHHRDRSYAESLGQPYNFLRNTPTSAVDEYGLAVKIPVNIPKTDELKKAIKTYSAECKADGVADDLTCHTICDAFYGNVGEEYVAQCMLACGDCELGSYCKSKPPGVPPKKSPPPKKNPRPKKKPKTAD